MVLEHTETRLFRAGETVLTPGSSDRALYLLVDGRLERAERRDPPDQHVRRGRVPRRPPARGRPSTATSDGEVMRLELRGVRGALRPRPDLGRAHPARPRRDPRRPPARRRRPDAGVDGLMAAISSPTTRRSRRACRSRAWQAIRAASLVVALVVAGAADRGAGHGPVRDVEGRHPAAAAAVHGRPGRVAQHLPAGRPPTRRRALLGITKGLNRAERG